MSHVWLIRHGQASFGADDYDKLSDHGIRQARMLGEWLAARDIRPARMMVGTLKRQRETAEALAEGLGGAGRAPPHPVQAALAAGKHLHGASDVFDEVVRRYLSLLTQDAAKVDQGSAAPPCRTTARPLHTGFPNIFGAAVSETAMRPNPRSRGWRRRGTRRSPS